MNITAPKTVADSTLPLLVTLVLARKQARWQWRSCADEHKHKWAMIVNRLDARIRLGESYVDDHLDTHGFHVKREIVE